MTTGANPEATPQDDTPGAPEPSSRPRATEKIAIAFADIKIAHSVFALPFAILAAFLAGPGRDLSAQRDTKWWAFAVKLGLIVLCMVFARTWAMLVNRVADRKLDAANPRTAKRAFAAGRLSTTDGLLMLAGSAGLFIGACALFTVFFDNLWPLYGSVPVLVWIAFYSFTKRFTLLCHFFLGGALAISPIAAAVAVDPQALWMPSLWCLAGMVVCWVAGFDVIYALQDHEHDSEAGLHSIPAKLGPARAINLSRALHAACFLALLGAWAFNPHLASAFAIGVGATGALLIAEHLVLTKRGEAGLNMAFFTLNGVISLVLGATGIADVFL
jgi:4-hydroxybenzoate polyprenyltransferase